MAGKDTGSAMGVGGSGGIFSRKTELVADLTSAFKTLNQELEKTKKLSEDISRNLKGSFPGGGAGNLLGSSFGSSTGTNSVEENDGSKNGTSGGQIALNFLKGAFKVGGMAMQAMPSVQQSFEQDLLRARFGFYGGSNANAAQMRMARGGTTTDPLDAARASMTGASMGLLPGLSNFKTIEQSAMSASNLLPGIGLQGGMQATAALNQGRNVNMLRMIGVNVRGTDGLMRGFDDIAKDLWKNLNAQKTGSAKISKEDLSMSLQPGNALASMMDQYFGNDPLLRQQVISKLMDMAGAGGSTITSGSAAKTRLAGEGATTTAALSVSDKNAASLNVNQALAPSILTGFEKANELLATASNTLADAARSAGIIGDTIRAAATGKGFVDTIATSGNGAGAMGLGMAGNFLGSMAGSFLGGRGLGKAGNLLKSGGSSFFGGLRSFGSKGLNLVKGYGGKIARFGAAKGAAAYAGMEVLQNFLNKADVPDDVRYFANALFDMGQGATAGALTAGPGGAVAGMFAGGIGAATNPYGEGGGSDDVATASLGMIYPLSGKPPITSEFGKIRHLTFGNGQKSPSYGKEHGGVDFGVPEGTPVYAVTDGVVDPTGYDAPGFGNYIKTSNSDGAENFFGHLSRKLVEGGQRVKAGDIVGYSGNSGSSTGPHLHFEVRKGGNKLDPMSYLSGANANSLTNGAIPSSANSLTLKRGAGDLIMQPMGGEGPTAASSYGAFNKSSEAHTINYGGVTITFNMPEKSASDVRAIANEVKRVLSDDSIREKAVNR